MKSGHGAFVRGFDRSRRGSARPAILAVALLLAWGVFRDPPRAAGEVILQYFNNSWNEIAAKLPELAEAGYGALWLPPPQKGSSGASVGYDLYDPFDLGGLSQCGTVRTRYGTEAELLRLIEQAHRFGMRVYFDNIMNHRAFDVPGYNEYTPVDIYPGMVPEDFHLRVTEEGFYRKWDNTVNWGSTWEVQMRNLSDLIDIAHETPNANFGPVEGTPHDKLSFVRQPTHPEYYDYHPTQGYVGFGSPQLTTNLLAADPAFYTEDVGGYLCRNVRWLVDRTKVDGLRLDAVKHVPAYFFGEQWAGNKDASDAGYCGQAQRQFNLTRGFSDWDNHRDTVFDTEKNRDDAMMFGEHMGEPPSYDDYFAAGMRLVDARIHQTLNDNLGNPWGTLAGLDSTGYVPGRQFGANLGVPYAKSHDDNVAYREELHYALNLTRAGLPDIYTDGNRHAETLGASGGAFPRHANTAYLGQWNDNRIPNLVYIHNHFARGDQISKWSDGDVVIYERRDKREQPAMSDAAGTVLLFMLNDNYSAGQARGGYTTSFGHTPYNDDVFLYNYSSYGGGFYVYASQLGSVIIPPGGYFAFSLRSPEESDLWRAGGGRPLTIYQDGVAAGTLSTVRRDGPDGDPGFNPYGVADANAADYAYTYAVPRVTAGTNLSFVARVDGSAGNVLLKLDGGVDLNDPVTHALGDPRDNPPALASDVFLGYEQANFVFRQQPEKFAAKDSARNTIGSPGCETYSMTIGTGGYVTNRGSGVNDWTSSNTAMWVYHDPQALITASNQAPQAQFTPPPQSAANSNLTVWVKIGYGCTINKVYLYYTTNGTSWPEGAGGTGLGETRVVELFWVVTGDPDGGNIDWWKGTIPALPAGTVLRYKIGTSKRQGDAWGCSPPWDVPEPKTGGEVARKLKMMGVWAVSNFNTRTIRYRPHNDYGVCATGLVEGFHVLAGRAFLPRTNQASIYNTFVQPFYLDLVAPTGEVAYPVPGETLASKEYGVVVRTDPTVSAAWYHIDDADPANDDGRTGQANGNGTNTAGQTAWVPAYSVTPSLSVASAWPDEWRFNYRNIPAGNSDAMLYVKLAELSSSTNPLLSDAAGHFLTLTRAVKANAPAYDLYVAWPQNDSDYVWTGYVMKVCFSQALADGVDTNTLRDRFLIRLDDATQGRGACGFEWGVDGAHHALTFPVPELYNGDSNFLHSIVVTHTNAAGGGTTLQATRYVKARPVDTPASVQIVDPPEFDSDGKPYAIVLPDVANPAPTQRQYQIRVETDRSVRQVWIVFTNSSGTASALPTVTNRMTGTVAVVHGSDSVAGAGTWFDSQLGTGQRVLVATNLVTVAQVVSSNSLRLTAPYPGVTASGLTAYRLDGNPIASGSKYDWNFWWTNMTAGTFQFYAQADTNGDPATVEAGDLRTTRVVLRQSVGSDTNDLDDDDDGLYDSNESNATNLPSTNPESWNNGQVHIWNIFGRSDPLLPDTDGDGLPDGLELGWRNAGGATDTNRDTNGDGWKNFRSDLDPPFYNTVPDNAGVPGYNFNDSRTKLIAGSVTDPNNPDSDYDGLPDGVEDRNRNGWVDGDGSALGPDQPYGERAGWPDGAWDAAWTETDPNHADTDGDGLSDGRGEDVNANGWIDGDNNSNRVWNAGERWLETDPLQPDTDGDGLPDGWEVTYNLDPFDDGVVGHTNRNNGAIVANTTHGAAGNPDGDTLVIGGVTNPYPNLQEYQNGTHPRVADTGEPPPPGAITVGRGPALGVINGTTYYQEFTDWTWDDLLALDKYEGDGWNNQQGDIYMRWDGFDSSRDITAFYAKDGGADGLFYFRVDFADLQAHAEEGFLDLYVVVNVGNPAVGEMGLPDEVDAYTSNKWQVVVAVYQSNLGRVYVDTVPGYNSTSLGDSYNLPAFGVVSRDLGSSDGFKGACFNSELDAVEFAISRKALTDAGWNGQNASNFHYQVFTTKDGTCNACNAGKPGDGDIGGRNDLTDSITDDNVCEDYWETRARAPSVLSHWFTGSDQPGRAKVAIVAHGNQALLPGQAVQQLINDGQGAGYHRLLKAHEVFEQAVNLHITPTLAMAMQWAAADTNLGSAWRDGAAFNRWIAELAATGTVALTASTFSDHMLPYFTGDFNRDNVALASNVLHAIYGVNFTAATPFWTPERLLDAGVFAKLRDVGYPHTVLDQNTHLFRWFGRTDSMGENGYSINRIHDVDAYVINNQPSSYLFANTDSGLSLSLRNLLSRRARGDAHRLVTLFCTWEDFGSLAQADAYDRNLRWLANHPWVKLVAFEDVAAGRVDLDGDGHGDSWWALDRGAPALSKQGHDWLDHASQGNYDNWYLGSALEESLRDRHFPIRAGTNTYLPYGSLSVPGLLTSAWAQVRSISSASLAPLARATLHASVFETAFHEEDNHDLSRWSTGDYMHPDTSSNSLVAFARYAQAQTRVAAVFKQVDNWAAAAAGMGTTQVNQVDADLDGEAEYVLANNRLFALFERSGGRLVAAWARDPANGSVYQAAGNPVGYSGAETEDEGAWSVETNGSLVAYRTSCFKDWWAGTTDYVNMLYAFAAVANGWQITSADGKIRKTVTLAPSNTLIEAQYQVNPALNGGVLYVRHGLSPNLYDLLLHGQSTLGCEQHGGGAMTLSNHAAGVVVTADIRYRDAGHNTAFNTQAVDDDPAHNVTFYTVNMRNQVQTHQVELLGTNTFSFALGFRAESAAADTDGDGIPDDWETASFGDLATANGVTDWDGDGARDWMECVAGTDPKAAGDRLHVAHYTNNAAGFTIQFPSKEQRTYYIWYNNSGLRAPAWSNATPSGLAGTGGTITWTDNGSQTAPPPAQMTNRHYKIRVTSP